jgi:hypothetical protein
MTPRHPEPLTQSEEHDARGFWTGSFCDRWWSTLDAARARITALEREAEERHAKAVAMLDKVRAERDEAQERWREHKTTCCCCQMSAERDALRAEVEAWRKAYDKALPNHSSLHRLFPEEMLDEPCRLRAQNEGGERG